METQIEKVEQEVTSGVDVASRKILATCRGELTTLLRNGVKADIDSEKYNSSELHEMRKVREEVVADAYDIIRSSCVGAMIGTVSEEDISLYTPDIAEEAEEAALGMSG